MPLLKRKTFSLLDPPKDLDANESVFQVRFTKEIFRDYQEYLKRLNLYRQRIWTCKVTGKTNLTYEEALVSEHRAYEKVQQFPKELVGPTLHMIQYSTLSLMNLVDKVWVKMQEDIFEGLELHARKKDSNLPCRILKVITDGSTLKYEVGWLNREKKITETSILNSDDLIRKRPPLSRNMLKVFIKESTSQNAPWVVREDLAKKYGVPTNPPEEMKSKFVYQNGFLRCNKQTKRTIQEDTENGEKIKRRKRGVENGGLTDEEMAPVKYPIEDSLLKPSSDDPIFTKRPPLVRDFKVPVGSVGYLLSVWDFCSSFGRHLHLSPFSLTDFENAICHREGNVVLIVEVHATIFYLLMRDEGDYFKSSPSKKRKSKISLVNWTEYLCDFLEKEDREALFSNNLQTIKRGHYGLLDTDVKLRILHELVEEALTTASIREKLDEQIQQQTALRAANREEARKKKELEDSAKSESEKVEMGQATSSDKVQVKGKDKEKSSEKKKPDEAQQHNLEREIEKLNIRTNPLGKDRDHSRYWFFRREGRLFVESSDSKQWGYYSTKEELDALIGSLNPKGIREMALKKQLERFYQRISTSLEKRTKEVYQKILLEEAVLRRSTRVRAQPRDNPAMSFLKYSNKWKEA
ncbi:DDT domain-containing protein [Rhynchospora pubera]|uniref:DDT domain-containing protein n=1 Tax=Rhynchospora pubera TaxID=906938 RepID=A0AAV8FH75_9POAL|nr:DDT domain-containing protein [Rhynchospora pubera]KAJ4790381.1 DDT domain-containing protein [Rhynchospora pubera]KAJ4814224.1 DDT domain-containing protein [Rhynchospora pubera]